LLFSFSDELEQLAGKLRSMQDEIQRKTKWREGNAIHLQNGLGTRAICRSCRIAGED